VRSVIVALLRIPVLWDVALWHCVTVQAVPTISKGCTTVTVSDVLRDRTFYFDCLFLNMEVT